MDAIRSMAREEKGKIDLFLLEKLRARIIAFFELIGHIQILNLKT
jgi:hypothetical protein